MAIRNPFRVQKTKAEEIPLTPLRRAVLLLLKELAQTAPPDFVKGVLPPEILEKLCRDMLAKMPEAMLVSAVRSAADFTAQLVELIPPDLKLVTETESSKANA